ncbi:hypothetical protein U1839_24855 [Sphingomonas sp. RT2P30]
MSSAGYVVMANGDDAEVVRKAFTSKLLDGAVTRMRWVRNG